MQGHCTDSLIHFWVIWVNPLYILCICVYVQCDAGNLPRQTKSYRVALYICTGRLDTRNLTKLSNSHEWQDVCMVVLDCCSYSFHFRVESCVVTLYVCSESRGGGAISFWSAIPRRDSGLLNNGGEGGGWGWIPLSALFSRRRRFQVQINARSLPKIAPG